MERAQVTTVHEDYAFACMRCGHGWEQAYDIEHHTDADGCPLLLYYTDGERVTSPFSRLTCAVCGSNVVRILRPGRVRDAVRAQHQPATGAGTRDTGQRGRRRR